MNKKELEDLVTKQQAQLARYKGRLADLVAAHKCLIKEKEVLEASLKAMSQSSPLLSSTEASTTSTVNSKASSPEKGSSDDGGGGEESDGCGVGSGGEEDSIESLKKRLTTLMNSIATLSEEKSRMEAGFQADKRLLRAEKLQASL
ncbi:hypothetical protein AAG570_008782 [Ranatra chinensis]|uniref:Uncharacterized protein n=1 Tax=Ranatra chinensis TaxID=642074 RepID=A0ABD0YRW0_9HEMI